MKFIIIYLVMINLYGLFIMSSDKKKAKTKSWRVPESKLFGVAILFGSLGILLGMKLFHHKTKHMKFVLGIPTVTIIQVFLFYKFILWIRF